MDSMFAGLPAGTTIASWFNAKTWGSGYDVRLTASFIVASLAVASAVTGAPLITWSTIVELEPKLVDNRVFGLCNSNCSAITVNIGQRGRCRNMDRGVRDVAGFRSA